MKNLLLCWISGNDLKASEGTLERGGAGQIATCLATLRAPRVILLSACIDAADEARHLRYVEWLMRRCPRLEIVHRSCHIDPRSSIEIYRVERAELDSLYRHDADRRVHLNLSSGTRTMSFLWVLLAKSGLYDPEPVLVDWRDDNRVGTLDLPFDVTHELGEERRRRAEAAKGNKLAARGGSVAGLTDKHLNDLAGWSPTYREKLEELLDAQRTRRAILIQGEAGTGKSRLAAYLSPPESTFELKCAGLTLDTLKARLKGLLDPRTKSLRAPKFWRLLRIDRLAPDCQAELLKALESRQRTGAPAVQLISTSRENLSALSAADRFLRALQHRVSEFEIHLPALRELRDDFSRIANGLLREVGAAAGKTPSHSLKPAALNALRAHDWADNLAELRWFFERVIDYSEGEITLEMVLRALPPSRCAGRGTESAMIIPDKFHLVNHVSEIERGYIEAAMAKTGGKRGPAAELLGFKSYQTLDNHIARLFPENYFSVADYAGKSRQARARKKKRD